MKKYFLSTLILLLAPSFADSNTKFNVVINPHTIKINDGTDISPDTSNTIKCGVGEGETRRSLFLKISNGEDVTKVCTSNITDFSTLFSDNATFNQDISNWDVSNGTDFSNMFGLAKSFNQDISNWDVSNGINFTSMFSHASNFNQPLNNWNVSKGINFSYMFNKANSFNQNISNWNVSKATSWNNFSQNAPLKDEYKPKFN